MSSTQQTHRVRACPLVLLSVFFLTAPTADAIAAVPEKGRNDVMTQASAVSGPARPAPAEHTGTVRPAPKTRPSSFAPVDPRPLKPEYVGEATLLAPLTTRSAQTMPTALAADHFDADGVLDLLGGYTSPEGHRLTLHLGNPRALGDDDPDAPAAHAPFRTPGRVFELPVAPDFIGTGDFDNDGHRDAVIAARGDEHLYLLCGDGSGGFAPARPVTLEGAVTALVSGEINRRDGLADLVVGVTGPKGSAALVFESASGALSDDPERIALPAPPTTLVLDRFDDAEPGDLALGVGREVMILHGRDRQLSLHPMRRNGVPPAVVERVAELDAPIVSIAAGRFVWDDRRRVQLAVLSGTGTLTVLGRTGDDHAAGVWRSLGDDRVQDRAVAGDRLVTARISALPLDEVVVLDGEGRSLRLALGEVPAVGEPEFGATPTLLAELPARPVAVLPMHWNGDALNDLVLLREGVLAPTMIPTAPAAGIGVNSLIDTGFPAQVGDGMCQLSEAMTNANANADLTAGDCAAGSGADTISIVVSPITVGAPLPALTDPGDSILGLVLPANCVDIEGATFAVPGPGLTLLGGSHSVRAVAVWGFGAEGIRIAPPGTTSIVDGTFIGTKCGAFATVSNGGDGINIIDSSGNLIGGPGGPPQSFILDNGGNGIAIRESAPGLSAGNRVISNYVGTTGMGLPRPNALDGILLESTDGATIGGTAPGEGNTLSGNAGHGIELLAVADAAKGNVIQGNFIGTNPAGAFAIPNTGDGVRITDGDSNTIGGVGPAARNIISRNMGEGVFLNAGLFGGSVFNKVQGNYIGVDSAGGLALGNGSLGVRVEDSRDNLIGGAAVGAGNVVSGNSLFGIAVVTFANPALVTRNTIQGNLVGVDATGTTAIPHPFSGIIVQDTSDNLVGGGLPGEGNVVSGNGQTGVFLTAANFLPLQTTANRVFGNFLGTDLTGMAAVGNGFNGVAIQEAQGNRIGGTLPGEGNVISGNTNEGVFIGSFNIAGNPADNAVQGNAIGVDVLGAPLPNLGNGVLIRDAPDNTIGGTAPGAGNTIRANSGAGVAVEEVAPFPATGNRILGNSISANGSLGIDLLNDGIPQANDPLDPDTGPNGIQNHPLVTRADIGISETVIEGTVSTTPGASIRVELFNSGLCDPSGFGEGRDYLTFVDVPVDAAGLGMFSVILPTTLGIGDPVTATATDNTTNDTSEFSPCFAASTCVHVDFGNTIVAHDANTLGWGASEDARWVKGPLAGVSGYAVSGTGTLLGNSLDISADNPGAGEGLYYLLRLQACGSWQTTVGAEPQRDVQLP